VRQLPGIKEAQVQRAWPNVVSVRVQEREPAAVWRSAGVEYVVDEEGVVLNRPVMGGLPAITQTDGAVLNAGDKVSGDAVRLAAHLGTLVPSAVGQRVARFEYSSEVGIDIVTERGLRVHFGDGQNVEYKLQLWRGIAEQARTEKLTPSEIDLRFGQWAAVR
jgi:cell division septal protein FtsQ